MRGDITIPSPISERGLPSKQPSPLQRLTQSITPMLCGRYDSHAAVEVVEGLRKAGIYARVLGNVAYVMVSPLTPAEVCVDTMSSMKRVILELEKRRATPNPPESVADYV